VLEALPVSPAEAAASQWAAVAVDPLQAGAARPQPFDTVTGRPAGVHLHWALPDGLTRGERRPAPADTALSAAAQTDTAQSEQRDQRRTEFTPVPDRWLVVRIQAGATQTAPRRAAAWVVSGALDPARRRAVPLSEWREDRAAAAPPVTAMGPGDPTFAVYYDNTRNLLGFHDPLKDVASGPLTYMVCGWYARLEDDPLHAPTTEQRWMGLLKRMGWSVDETVIEELRKQARSRQFGQVLQGADQRSEKKGVSVGGADADGEAQGLYVQVGSGASKFVKSANSANNASGRSVIYTERSLFTPYWPRQLLCHGAVFDVRWGDRGGAFDHAGAGVPPPNTVGLAVGNTAAQALAALAAQQAADPSLARLLDAFATGALSELSQQSGLARLESHLHAEDFSSLPGGFVVDQIQQGDAFAPASAAETPSAPRHTAPAGAGRDRNEKFAASQIKAQRRFFKAGASVHELQQRLDEDPDQPKSRASQAPAAQPRATETVRRALPRWFEPRDPVLLLQQGRRGYKHGEDHAIDGTLGCRISGQTVGRLGVLPWREYPGGVHKGPLVDVLGSDLSTDDLQSGQIPAECGALFFETLLFDPTSVPVARDAVIRRAGRMAVPKGAKASLVSAAEAGQRVQVEQTLLLLAAADPQIDMQALAALSNLSGTRPHPISQHRWCRPWAPIELAWEVAWYPSPGAERDWALQQTDFALRSGVPTGTDGAPAFTLRGRSLLTPSVARTLERQLRRFLDDEAEGERDEATPSEEADLARIQADFAKLDVLGASISGLHDALMARMPVPGLAGAPGPDAWQPVPGATALWLLRAGHLRVTRARVIDGFGQFHDLGAATLAAPVRAEDLVSRAGPAYLALPPRVQEPTRLMFRLLDAADDAREATRERSPVCGWMVPDHMDEAVEVFDAAAH